MFLFKNVRISLASFMAVFLLTALPGFTDIDPQSIRGMWLFDEGKGGSLLMRQKTETMVRFMAQNGSMGNLEKHLNLMVPAIGLRFRTQTLSGLRRASPSRLPSITRGARLVAHSLVKTMRIHHRQCRGIFFGTMDPRTP